MSGEVPSGSDGGYSLQSVYVVVRHGDRSALHNVPRLSAARPFSCLFDTNLIHSVTDLPEYLSSVKLQPYSRVGKTYEGFRLFPNKVKLRCNVI